MQALTDTLQSDSDFFSGIQIAGFHRTPTELANKGSVREQILGTNLNYQSQDKALSAGVTAVGTHYSSPIQKTGAPYQLYEFTGKSNFNLGGNYAYTWQNFYLFGETAVSKSSGLGAVNGLIANLSNKLEVAMVYR